MPAVAEKKAEIVLRPGLQSDIALLMHLFDEDDHDRGRAIGSPLSRSRVERTVTEMVWSKNVHVIEIDGVAVGGAHIQLGPSPYTDDVVAYVSLLYIAPQYRKRSSAVVDFIEKLFSSNPHCTRILISVPEDCDDASVMRRFYSLRGYSVLETHMVKKLR